VLVLAAAGAGRAALARDPVPDPAGGAQLGDGRELLGRDGPAELDAVERLVDGQPGVGERA
jgi:hypothetical protein